MPACPMPIFVGLAPLFTFSETPDKRILEKMEWVLLALTAPLVLLALASQALLVTALMVAITWTLAFVAHAWVRQVLGIRTGKITLILFWLAMEYGWLTIAPGQAIFLGDALVRLGTWTRWTAYTGYLGTGAWILMVNWTAYKAFFGQSGWSWGWLLAGVVTLAGPALFSLTLPDSHVTREAMIKLYGGQPFEGTVAYLARGEWVVRTAAWISALILLFTAVTSQTRKK